LRTVVALFVLMTTSAAAQVTPPAASASLQEVAEKRSAEWDALAGSLEAKLARMLPCDARVRTTIEEVSRASEARLTALSQYLKSTAAQAKRDAEAARSAMAEQEMNAREMDAERAEAHQEEAAVDAQLADLTDSAKRRGSIDGAQKKLEAIASALRQRASVADQQTERRAALTASLRDLIGASDARQQAFEGEIVVTDRETARWAEYYAIRLERAETECSLTNQAPKPRQQKKKP
jgi:hypothetical protein